jgi:ribosomal protein S18 acetylase RimI-like enzyme
MTRRDGEGLTGEQLREIAYRALGVPRPRNGQIPGHEWTVRDGVILTRTRLPGFSRATVLGDTPPPARIFALADEYLGDVPGGYTVMLDGNAGHPMEEELRARGWVLEHDDPGMVLPAIPELPPVPPELEIRRVTDEAALQDFWGEGDPDDVDEFGVPVNLTCYFNPTVAYALDPDVGLFVGYVEGQAVATAGLYRKGDIAEMGAVWTAEASRRRGYGAALTWAAIHEGRARGCTTAAHKSSEMGYPVYTRMGFREVCRLRVYAPAGAPWLH